MWNFKPKKITNAILGLEAKIAPTVILSALCLLFLCSSLLSNNNDMINTIEKAIKYLTFKRKDSNYSKSNTDIKLASAL